MNAGADWNVSMYYHIFKALHNIKERDFDKWMGMTTDQLIGEVLKETSGRVNPSHIRKAIELL